MNRTLSILTLAMAVALPAGLAAQTSTVPANQPPGATTTTAQYQRLDDMKVLSTSGEEIGEVENVLVDASGRVSAVVVEIDQVLGMGGLNVVVPLDQLRFESGKLISGLTKEQFSALPRWKD